eukprot:5420617-Amphidinium_carterae.1
MWLLEKPLELTRCLTRTDQIHRQRLTKVRDLDLVASKCQRIVVNAQMASTRHAFERTVNPFFAALLVHEALKPSAPSSPADSNSQ